MSNGMSERDRVGSKNLDILNEVGGSAIGMMPGHHYSVVCRWRRLACENAIQKKFRPEVRGGIIKSGRKE